ncbi:Elongation factor 2 [Mycena kentingensis (nom. inval.)]|nr:Elongation factor 2 [Mycena kentingensis (nom. inval.)]
MRLSYQSLLLSSSFSIAAAQGAKPSLDQAAQQLFRDRLFQTNLRGPRWTGNDNQNVLTATVAAAMEVAGLTVQTLDTQFSRWDPRWWSLSLKLTDGTTKALPTTGFWPYSGDSGLKGVTAPLHDAGSYTLFTNETANLDSINLSNLPSNGSILFFDNPSPTRNYSAPEYTLLGSSVPPSKIPELGNLTNPHWQSAKTLDFAALKTQGVAGVIASWVNTSDENGALQFLPNSGAPGDGSVHYDVPSVYVGNSTGETIRKLARRGRIASATIVLDAPTLEATTTTVIGHLAGTKGSNETVLVYTHSDGPSIIEENGPILLLTMAEYFAAHPLSINIDFVITTGHMSGGHVNESSWMTARPDILANAKAAIVAEHFGAIEWKDNHASGKPIYEPTGRFEPMWTMANSSAESSHLHELYLDAFEGTTRHLRMALLADGHWYGAGGSSTLGMSHIPTVGIIPQPDYLWAAMSDGGWSKLDVDLAVTQINVMLRLITSIDAQFVAGTL